MMGSCATKPSIRRKTTPHKAEEPISIHINGELHGSCWPPKSRARIKVEIVAASEAEPRKSTRWNFDFPSVSSEDEDGSGPSSFQATKMIATNARGH